MTRIACITANLGAYDNPVEWAPQVVSGAEVTVHRFTDSNFPPRPKAMTSALQVGLLKWFGPEFVPPADLYFWCDASCALLDPGCLQRWVDRLGDAELLLFAHPDRSTIRAEWEFMTARMARPGETYLTGRYRGEWLDEQYARIVADRDFVDRQLFASTAFMYRPTPRVKALLERVWLAKTKYLLHDQLSLAYHVGKSDVPFNVIPEKYTDCNLMTYVRNRRAA